MKKILFTLTFLAIAICAYAQPRAIGLRVGVSGLEASYEHSFTKVQFLEGNIGLDFGYNANGTPGIKAEGTYNFVWARPAWTNKGTWAIYSGPGAAIGYVNDVVTNIKDKTFTPYTKNGFMLGVSVQVGLEYTFNFPLQLAVDLRPIFGMHVSGKHTYQNPTKPEETLSHGARIGFYDNGLLGFVPTISIRYRFR